MNYIKQFDDLSADYVSFKKEEGEAGLDAIEKNIQSGKLVIANTNQGAGHYLVVKGIKYKNGERIIIVDDPYLGYWAPENNKTEYTEDEFLSIWKHARINDARRFVVVSKDR